MLKKIKQALKACNEFVEDFRRYCAEVAEEQKTTIPVAVDTVDVAPYPGFDIIGPDEVFAALQFEAASVEDVIGTYGKALANAMGLPVPSIPPVIIMPSNVVEGIEGPASACVIYDEEGDPQAINVAGGRLDGARVQFDPMEDPEYMVFSVRTPEWTRAVCLDFATQLAHILHEDGKNESIAYAAARKAALRTASKAVDKVLGTNAMFRLGELGDDEDEVLN